MYGRSDSFSHYSFDLILVKFAPDGTELWNVTYGDRGDKYDAGEGVVIDPTGYIYVCGQTETYGSDLVLIKYNPSGGMVWSRVWGGLYSGGKDLVLDSSGNIYVCGWTYYGVGEADFALVVFDPNGNRLWNRTWGGYGSDYAYDLHFDSSDNIYLSGWTNSFGNGGWDFGLVKFGVSGNNNQDATPISGFTWAFIMLGFPLPIVLIIVVNRKKKVCRGLNSLVPRIS